MIPAYNPAGLQQLWLLRESHKALHQGKLTDEEYQLLVTKYPTGFYTPNSFIRLGLFILSQMAASSVLGLLSMVLLLTASEKTYGYLLLFQGVICLAGLEYLIKRKKHFRSGVDDALLWMGVAYLAGGLYLRYSPSVSLMVLVVLVLTVIGSLRYTDMLLSVTALVALLAFTYLEYPKAGDWAKLTLPFVLMALSLLAAWLTGRLQHYYRYRFHENCLKAVQVTALVGFFVCSNFYVLYELGPNFIAWPKAFYALDTFFWVATIVLPFALLLLGTILRDRLYLRLGLLYLIALVFLLRNYYHKMPLEWVMTLLGAGITLLAYLLTRYLKKPRHGIVSFRLTSQNLTGLEQAEALLISHTMGSTGTPPPQYPLGGGSSGGGGVTGNY